MEIYCPNCERKRPSGDWRLVAPSEASWKVRGVVKGGGTVCDPEESYTTDTGAPWELICGACFERIDPGPVTFMTDEEWRTFQRTRELVPCGHSRCRQHWIDTGVGACVPEAEVEG